MDVQKASEIIKEGGIVAFPTETIYGIGADALNEDAVKRLFALKKRPKDNPFLVIVSDREMLDNLVAEIPPKAEKLMDKFWPGPLTIVFKKKDTVSDLVTSGLDTLAVRLESHPVALELVKSAGVPIVAPSANLAGQAPPMVAEEVRKTFSDIPVLKGEITHGKASTIITSEGKVLREGAIPIAELKEFLDHS